MIHASVRDNLLGWQGSFIGRKRESVESNAFVPLLGNLEGEK